MKSHIQNLLNWSNRSPIALWSVAGATFFWLVIVLPFLSFYQNGVEPIYSPQLKGNQDMAQYYMGATIVLEKAYDSMYPIPHSNLVCNVGWPQSSTVKPGYAALMEQRGVEDTNRYMQPPPTAILLAPLGLLSYPTARVVWAVLMGICCWGACFFGNLLGKAAGCSRLERVIWWGVWGFSPLMIRTIRVANCLPLVVIMLSIAILALFRNKPMMATLGCIAAVLLKGTGFILIPFILLLRRWKIVLLGGVIAVLINLITMAITGTDVYVEFLTEIYPTTRIPDPFQGNQTVYGFLYRVLGNSAFTSPIVDIIRLTGLLISGILLAAIWNAREAIRQDFSMYLAAIMAFLGVYIIWSPYCWDHYLLLYIPFLTALWHHCRSRAMRATMITAVCMMWLPMAAIRNGYFVQNEPWHSHLLFGQVILIGIAFIQFHKKQPTSRKHP